MTPPRPVRFHALCCTAAALAAAVGSAQAEKSDRSKPMTLESDKPCVVNLVKNTSSCSGNVVITQGTLLIRADRVELRETTDGYQVASAIGVDGKPAQYRQKRDGVDEFVEGAAQRIDYDSRANTLRFEGQATARRLRGTVTADEIHGSSILWDNTAEQFSVQGGAATNDNPSGRVRAVIAPRDPAASAPPASSARPASAPALRSTPSLGERR
jgi:lipopolysaccharide export system protein LptA